MKNRKFLVFLLVFTLIFAFSLKAYADERLKMSTTTSTENSGLLNVLLPPFEKRFNVRVDVIPVGTGKALKLGSNGDVDIVFVHARKAEEKFVAEGYGVNRRDVMYNDFILLGPKNDPSGARGAKSAVDAFKKISKGKIPFFSRGDNSGTHKKEKAIWKKAGIKPEGRWYFETGRGMGDTIVTANEKLGYTIADRGTYLAFKNKIDIVVVYEGDKILYNPYGIIAVNPAKYPHTNYVMAMAFIGWVTSPEGQKLIREYKKFGEVLFKTLAIP
ncbi:MAG TPA: substrate-binding domain-containing protein [Nitrospinota bacterium]|nr:substrate-binding domain-containing protein [Nitrospinota bacterium]